MPRHTYPPLVTVDPLISEESSERRQRQDRAWIDDVALRTLTRPTAQKQMGFSFTQPLANGLIG